ncbi:MAG: DUF1854 domain-containing protein [Planctomycetota bacterium]|jgi:hypothetical protein|nr:DUF1854 domain-containing protein [Planctomycetota bacterium]
MALGSARRFPHDLHSHDAAASAAGDRPGPPSPEDAGGKPPSRAGGRLWREDGKLLYDCGDGNAASARLLWARPLSGRGGPVSVMAAGKKREIRYLESPDLLDPESRRIALEELSRGVVMPRITRIHSVTSRFGNFYWNVETDFGPKTFLLTSPENNTVRPDPDTIVLKDASGNAFEITPVSGLDRASLREFDRVYTVHGPEL